MAFNGGKQAAGSLALAAVFLLLLGCPQSSQVTVPDCSGMTLTQAQAAIAGAGLVYGGSTQQYSPTAPMGEVISQVPQPGATVAQGSSVTLVISKGPAFLPVPDLAGMTYSAAEFALAAAGLSVGILTYQYSETVPVAVVISQSPASGVIVEAETAVNLTVSQGPAPIVVPNVLGMMQGVAQVAITTARLTVGAVSEAYATVPAGVVVYQSPVAGVSVVAGTSVDLIVSKGPQWVCVPDVTGMNLADAEAALEAAALVVGEVTEVFDPTVDAGGVIEQNPDSGTMAGSGTAVDLTVSKGPQPVGVPNVIGKGRWTAEGILELAGFVAGDVTEEFSNLVPAGNVISQDPPPGVIAQPGTAVDLVVSKGAPPVAFADPNLEAAVRWAVSKPEGVLHAEDLAPLTMLDASSQEIEFLDGIESCCNLQVLRLLANTIHDLAPLAELPDLMALYLDMNPLADLTPLAELENLEVLSLCTCQLGNISALAGLNNLAWLALSNNMIGNLTPLSGLENLTTLLLDNNEIINISPIGGLTSLTSLLLNGNLISDVSALAGLTSLQQLTLHQNTVSNIGPLAGLTSLTDLSLYANQISDVGPIANLLALQQLLLNDNLISDVSALAGLQNLQYLWLQDNQIVELDALSANTGLETGDEVDVRSNPLGDRALCFNIPIVVDRGANVLYEAITCLPVTVPDVVGIDRATAEFAVDDAGLFLGTVQLTYSDTVPENLVMTQDPAAGTTVEWRTEVNLEVSRGPLLAEFPDAALDAAVRDLIGKPEGPILASELAAVTSMSCNDKGIQDLAGIEYCVNIETLLLPNNAISDISALSGLTALKYLDLAGNTIDDLTPLAGLVNLEELDLSSTGCSAVAPLASLANLQVLHLENNLIANLTGLGSLTSLRELALHNNRITSLAPLAGAVNLEWLSLSENLVGGLAGIETLTKLQALFLANNQIIDLAPLAGLLSMQHLEIQSNGITSLASLAALTNLEHLRAEKNIISDLAPLAGLANLTYLCLSENHVANIAPLEGLTALEWLWLDKNLIEDIEPLVSNTGIGDGDSVVLDDNPLNQEALCTMIPALEARGVIVTRTGVCTGG